MNNTISKIHLLRVKGSKDQNKVTFAELFFDLVFVFAVTQLSHTLLKQFNLLGALQTGFLLMAVWWVWIYTSWATNWLNPQTTGVRLLLYMLMFVGLILSMSIPKAFESHGLIFALSYTGMQISRSLFMCWVFYNHQLKNFKNFVRITMWLFLSAIFWIAGGLNEGSVRITLWCIALFIEYISPAIYFWIPGMGKSKTVDWDISGEHIAERCGLFIIIALGESILVTGITFSHMDLMSTHSLAFLNSFICTVAMWWIYFNIGAEHGSHYIAHAEDPGRVARLIYTYLHMLVVAAIILVAVTDELIIEHPSGHTEFKTALVILGGPALYIFSNLLFKKSICGRFSRSHILGTITLISLMAYYKYTTPLLLGSASTVVLLIVAAWETYAVKNKNYNCTKHYIT